MKTTQEKAIRFKALHVKGNPLVLYNIWDAGTAKLVAEAGAKAIATGSWAVAVANGFDDGENLPLETALHNLGQVVKSVDLPVTIDLESGYGSAPEHIADTVTRAVTLGAVGVNLEDQVIGTNALYGINDQAARISAARNAADALGIPVFINARTDVLLQAEPNDQKENLLAHIQERAAAYFQAGGDGLFVPGLTDQTMIKTLCATSPMPVNIMMQTDSPTHQELSELGVARISYGPGSYMVAMEAVRVAARSIYE